MTNTETPTAFLAHDEAANALGHPYVYVRDVVGYLGSTEPVRLDLEGDHYADRDGDNPGYAAEYVELESYEVLETGRYLLQFACGDVLVCPADHSVALAHPAVVR